jgi:hypothetical protein
MEAQPEPDSERVGEFPPVFIPKTLYLYGAFAHDDFIDGLPLGWGNEETFVDPTSLQ